MGPFAPGPEYLPKAAPDMTQDDRNLLPGHACQVLAAHDIFVCHGANLGDGLMGPNEVCLGDIYELDEDRIPLRLIVTRDRIFLGMVTLLGCAAVVPASGIYQMDLLTVLPLWFASYIAPVSSSLFPLLPWFGFMAAGVLVSCFFLRAAAQGREDHFLYTVAGIGWVLVLV